jgi:hypothetical protein
MHAEDRVLLIDVENSVGPVRPRPALVRARVGALRAAAGDVHHVVACYSATDPAADVLVSVLAELGVAPWPVPPGRDAAETALLQHARYVVDRGGRTFVVASGDHRFTALADLGRLEVLAWDGHPISQRLEHAAHQLTRLPWPAAADHPAGPTPPDHPAPASTTAQAAAAAAAVNHWTGGRWYGQLVAARLRARAAQDRRQQRAEHARQLLVAVATGAGIAAGQRLADRLLPERRDH